MSKDEIKPIKLLISDVDGTLITAEKVLTECARAAVDRLRAAGILFSITSGRPPRGMAALSRELKLTTPIAAFNGGMLVSPDLKTLLEQRVLSADAAAKVVDYLQEQGLDVWVYRGADWFIRYPGAPHVETERRNVQFEPTVIKNLYDVLEGAVKIVGVSDDQTLVACCEAELRQRLGKLVSAARTQPYYVDVTHPDANKGRVVRQASRYFNIPLDEIAAIGDMPNDVLMFGIAGVSIAMGNATPEVQRTARYVTTSNEDEGFANAVDRFIIDESTTRNDLGLPQETRACLFDLDGVLTQTSKLHAVAWKKMFDGFLLENAKQTGKAFRPFDPVHDYALYVDGRMRVDGAACFLSSRGIHVSKEKLFELADRKDNLLLDLLKNEHVETYKGSVHYVHKVREAGLRTAVVSSSKHCEQVLASAGITHLFDARVDGNVAAHEKLAGKPSPDTYLAAAHAVGVNPSQAVVFEDALSGVEAGRSGHFGYVVGVDRIGQETDLRRHGANVVVKDLSELLERR